MKISILLPYKENFSKDYAGAVSIFINGVNKYSRFKNDIKVYGNTNYSNLLSKNYVNLSFKKSLFQSSSKTYVNNFLKIEKKRNSNIIEIHNRPNYLKYFKDTFEPKIVFYFHNDPLSMNGSKSISERLFILHFCSKIIFNSEWTKNRFFNEIDKFYLNSEKIEIINQSTSKSPVNLDSKKKIIMFVGKLNRSKGYDLFGKAAIKILNEFKDWKVLVYGDEPREEILFQHERLLQNGYESNDKILKSFKISSIAVACSRWDEPFGRSSLEASSRGCAVIVSNKGGLPETITDGIILKNLNVEEIYENIKELIIDKTKLKRIQKNSLQNFYLDNIYTSKQIDNYREKITKNKTYIKRSKFRILHVTNLNERHNGRLFYNTGRRINNGLIKLGHTVQTLSDRDTISRERKISDLTGSKSLNNKLLEIISNYNPNLLMLGHADQIQNTTLKTIKKFYPNIKICQWFLDKMDDNEWRMNKDRFSKKFRYVDVSFCTTHPSAIKSFSKNNVLFIPNPVDETFENLNIYNKKIFKHDLFFALSHGVHRGTLKLGKSDKRESLLRMLIKFNNEIKFHIFGIDKKQPIWAENFKNELSKCKMALNLSQGASLKFYSSDRIAQLVGNGILTFVDIKTKLNKIFSNNEIIFYKNIKDLSLKINRYKNDDKLRNLIAKKGMKKYHKHMNSKIVSEYMINKVFDINRKKRFFWEYK
ncbi:glycosyltransferase [Candidatus Pelagibacter bacterium nBUS_25]|uniref:glycosyltransferase n=1 Tax=Candidatus Pelagibacter bacterium nBUS_25 TaxID=3374187 RepID=UPI003EBC263D